MRSKKNKAKRFEGNVVVFEDLAIYNSNQQKDKKLNDKLKPFLKSIDCKPDLSIIENVE